MDIILPIYTKHNKDDDGGFAPINSIDGKLQSVVLSYSKPRHQTYPGVMLSDYISFPFHYNNNKIDPHFPIVCVSELPFDEHWFVTSVHLISALILLFTINWNRSPHSKDPNEILSIMFNDFIFSYVIRLFDLVRDMQK